ncbi:MAG: methionine--tRNA ligase [candidate division WOR-3 bacterium]|nr:methionine--tRNA ligase [candidate division WOR-3 bacterium]MDW8150987.1 methionine--tRNA ligase [candidate division WOR-3 bacterium]
MYRRILITSALPYANGPLHIGHLAGAYLPADIYTRFQKLKNRDAIHICGTDEHGVAITLSAKKENKTPKALVDYYHENIKNTFSRIGIYFENFSRTTRKLHYELSQSFFLSIYNKGYIEKRKVKQFYCENDKIFLPDRYITGTCPYCNYDKARGDQCEKCGKWLEPTELIEPRCTLCNSGPVLKDSFQYFFKLNEFEERLREYIASKKNKWKENVLNFVDNWLREGLKPRAITRDLEWGVPVPLEEAKNKVLYVWFDAPIGYISSTKEWSKDNWEKYWKDKDTKIVHFIGKDNIVFHSIVWPAMLMAEGSYNLPDEIPANEFLNLMGDKISTSRNWALWLDELLDRFEPDYIRFFIAYIMPEYKDSDFNLHDFKDRVNNELINKYGNLISRTLSFIVNFFESKIPDVELSEENIKDFNEIKKYISEAENYIENFEFRKALSTILSGVDYINAYIDRQKPWNLIKYDKEQVKRVIFTTIQLIRSISISFEPYIPFSTKKVLDAIGVLNYNWDSAKEIDYSIKGKGIKNIGNLYKKIEDKEIQELLSILHSRVLKEKNYITYEEFSKLDIRVGKVVSAQRVEKSRKLLKLLISLGNEKRQIIAGIGESYTPESLINKNVIVVVNLEPKKIMGLESNGMLLAAGEKPIILTTDGDVEEGSKVK